MTVDEWVADTLERLHSAGGLAEPSLFPTPYEEEQQVDENEETIEREVAGLFDPVPRPDTPEMMPASEYIKAAPGVSSRLDVVCCEDITAEDWAGNLAFVASLAPHMRSAMKVSTDRVTELMLMSAVVEDESLLKSWSDRPHLILSLGDGTENSGIYACFDRASETLVFAQMRAETRALCWSAIMAMALGLFEGDAMRCCFDREVFHNSLCTFVFVNELWSKEMVLDWSSVDVQIMDAPGRLARTAVDTRRTGLGATGWMLAV